MDSEKSAENPDYLHVPDLKKLRRFYYMTTERKTPDAELTKHLNSCADCKDALEFTALIIEMEKTLVYSF